ncbi:hypothetical protein R2R70_02265 [Cobetia sp. SIMBA_158]|uniref:hypothetical protein n=1 Tax=Cobetia sp. SIMBA_158 TaxID=3081617 RepID=UPI00397FE786
MSIHRLTEKQIQIISTIRAHAEVYGVDIDMNQLIESLPYKTTKESLQFSIRALIKKGMVEKGETQTRRGRRRRTFIITAFGKTMLGM